MSVVGLDIHRVFAEAAMLDDGKVTRGFGRVGMTREHLRGSCARKLIHDDHVVIEAMGDRHGGRREVIGLHVGHMVIANHRAQERSIQPRSGRHR